MNEFVKLVTKKRKERGISQEKLAEMLQVSTVTLSAIENGKAEMDVDMCKVAADYFNIPYSKLFNEYKKLEESSTNKDKRICVILISVAIVVLVANVLLEIGLNWYNQYLMHNYVYATVLDVEDDVIVVKNRANCGILTDSTYRIKLDGELSSMCSEIAKWDVVRIHYYLTLVDWCDNPSWSVSEIEKDEYSTYLESLYY